jgi:hypothetical protein
MALELIDNIAKHVRDRHPRMRDRKGRFISILKMKKGVAL